MKNLGFTLFSLFFFSFYLAAQTTISQRTAINEDNSIADNSAMLDVKSPDKGLLIPRLSIPNLLNPAPVTNPVVSLLVYNTNLATGEGFYYWSGFEWRPLLSFLPGEPSQIVDGDKDTKVVAAEDSVLVQVDGVKRLIVQDTDFKFLNKGGKEFIKLSGESGGEINVFDENCAEKATIQIEENAGQLILRGENDNRNIALRSTSDGNAGHVSLYNEDGELRIGMIVADSTGTIFLFGKNGTRNVLLTSDTDTENNGAIGVADEGGNNKGVLTVKDSVGVLRLLGKNGKSNAQLSRSDFANDGVIFLYNEDEKETVRLYSTPESGELILKSGNEDPLIELKKAPDNIAGQILVYGNNLSEKIRIGRDSGDFGFIQLNGSDDSKNIQFTKTVDEGGAIILYDSTSQFKATLQSLQDRGGLTLFGKSDNNSIELNSLEDGFGLMNVFNEQGAIATKLHSDANRFGHGDLQLFSSTNPNEARAHLFVDSDSSGYLDLSAPTLGSFAEIYQSNDEAIFCLTSDENSISLKDSNSDVTAHLFTPDYNSGELNLNGANNSRNIGLGTTDFNNANYGWMGVYDQNNNSRVRQYSSPFWEGAGVLEAYGENNNLNVLLGAFLQKNHGYLGIFDSGNQAWARTYINATGFGFSEAEVFRTIGNNEAWMYNSFDGGAFEIIGVNARMYINNGQGTVEADVKNFSMPHPEQPGKRIVYACIEGPEAAAYARGTTQLENGKATIELPDHFRLVVVEEGMTVILTPLSADSKGLAVTTKSLDGIVVQELMNGAGNYAFDWEVKSIRTGFEDYEIIRAERQHPRPYRDPNFKPESIIHSFDQRQ